MKEYIIQAKFNAAALRTRSDLVAAQKLALAGIKEAVREIVERDGGKILNDGSGYGVPGDKGEYASFMLVAVSDDAAVRIAALKDVASVSENRKFDLF